MSWWTWMVQGIGLNRQSQSGRKVFDGSSIGVFKCIFLWIKRHGVFFDQTTWVEQVWSCFWNRKSVWLNFSPGNWWPIKDIKMQSMGLFSLDQFQALMITRKIPLFGIFKDLSLLVLHWSLINGCRARRVVILSIFFVFLVPLGLSLSPFSLAWLKPQDAFLSQLSSYGSMDLFRENFMEIESTPLGGETL